MSPFFTCTPRDWFLRSGRLSSQGFTLLEILVTVAILGIVMLTALSALSAVNRTSAHIQETLTTTGAAAEAIGWIEADLNAIHVTAASLYRTPDVAEDPDPYGFRCFSGPEDPSDFKRLEFAARAHRPLAPTELEISAGALARVSYFVRRVDDRFVLMRTDVFDLQAGWDPPPPAAVICENVLRLEWSFIDDQGEVHDEWDSDEEQWKFATPRAVQLAIEIGEEGNSRTYHARFVLATAREARR